MVTRLLTKSEFLASFSAPMQRVPLDEGAPIRFWDYFDEIPLKDFTGWECPGKSASNVWNDSSGSYQHVLIDTQDANVFMVVILDLHANSVYGHYLLDLNFEYDRRPYLDRPPPDKLAPAKSSIWGDRRSVREIGYVANFCPLCRAIRAFKLFRIGSEPITFGIPRGIDNPRADVIVCCECGRPRKTEPVAYAAFVKKPTCSIESLIEQTYPKLRTSHADRLALEARIRRSPGSLTAEERHRLILEPFVLLNPEVRDNVTGFHNTDRESTIGCLGTILGFVLVFGIAIPIRPWSLQDHFLFASVIVFGVGTAYTLVQLCLVPRRFLRRKILPVLGRSLGPLNPTDAELKECLEICKAENMAIARKLILKTIQSELQKRFDR